MERMFRGATLTESLATCSPLFPPTGSGPHTSHRPAFEGHDALDCSPTGLSDSVGHGQCSQEPYVPRGATTSRLDGESFSEDLGQVAVAHGGRVCVMCM